jgi:hypothetical protein
MAWDVQAHDDRSELRTRFLVLSSVPRQELAHGLARLGIDPVACDLGQRFEYEEPIAEPGVRHPQSRFIDDFLVVENQIQVKRARSAFKRSCSPALALDREQGVENFARREPRLAHDGTVQEVRLRIDSDGSRLMPGRDLDAAENAAEAMNGEREM